MLLNDAQRAVLAQIDTGTTRVAAALGEIEVLVAEVRRRDADSAGMNPTTETSDALIARAKAAYTARRQALINAAEAMPQV